MELASTGPYQTAVMLHEESAAWERSIDLPKELADGRQDRGALQLAMTDAYSVHVRKEVEAL